MVWEVSVAHLRQCRIRKVMLSVEVWRDKEMLGHLVMDLGTAVPLHTKQDEAPVKSYCLIGTGASLELSLGLDEVEILYTCKVWRGTAVPRSITKCPSISLSLQTSTLSMTFLLLHCLS